MGWPNELSDLLKVHGLCEEASQAPDEGIGFYLPLERPETFELVLDGLSWQEKVAPRPPQDIRRHPRQKLSAPVLVVLELNLGGKRTVRLAFPARCRNISAGGICVIAANYLVPAPSGEPASSRTLTPLLINLERMLELGTSCIIGLRQQGEAPVWISGQVVRKRSLGGKMQELGIQFKSRLS